MYSQNTLIRIEIKQQQQKINKNVEEEEEIFLFENIKRKKIPYILPSTPNDLRTCRIHFDYFKGSYLVCA